MLDKFSSGLIDIQDHAILLVKGPDAEKFLQGQVTCDVAQSIINHGISQTSLGAHCTPKGRMLFSFRLCRLDEDTLALAIHRDLISQAKANLEKYSIFSKVEIIDTHGDYQLMGAKRKTLQESQYFPDLPAEANQAQHTDAGIIVAISDEDCELWLTREQATNLADKIPVTGDEHQWNLVLISAGIGEVRPQTVDMFIPQMLNLQAIGSGISFTKGCYTGQEVVARMTYLGKLKRHLYQFSLADSTKLPSSGDGLYTPENKQTIGNVVVAECNAADGCRLLAVVTHDAEAAGVYLDQNYQHQLQTLPLPYAITKQ